MCCLQLQVRRGDAEDRGSMFLQKLGTFYHTPGCTLQRTIITLWHFFITEIPLRVNGKITGTLNGKELSQLDLQSYVVTSDGRTYTALSHVSQDIGYDIQILNVLGAVIGWLFARPISKAVNGYELTGETVNHLEKGDKNDDSNDDKR